MARILILANNDVGLYKFRKELIEELVKSHDVILSLPDGAYVSKLRAIGCEYIHTPINRRGTNPLTDFKLLIRYIKILQRVKPDVVLTYTIKPNVYGGLACRLVRVPYISNITGLGTALQSRSLIQSITLILYKMGLKKASCVFFQNEFNKKFFVDRNIIKTKCRLIPGSGVNLIQHKFEEYPKDDTKINFLFIGRLMKEKGIEELLDAAKIIKGIYPNVNYDLIGVSEEDYQQKLNELSNLGIINYHGLQEDVHSFIKKSHVTILPSYHEGLANVLLESASAGRPVLASLVPGCLETFDEGISGFGFEVKNVASLVEVSKKFINLPYEQKKTMGIAGRRKMEDEFDRNLVISAYIEEINNRFNKENRYELIPEDY